MDKQLIFLHIEKSAGTSYRELFYNTFGNANVFWHGIDSKNNPDRLNNYFVIGGHEGYGIYNGENYIYLAVLREPIERVLSLYNYCKSVILERWKHQEGFDPKNLKNTIRNCPAFRDAVHNAQCRYLSGSQKIDDVINTINNKPFFIGCFNKIDIFNENLFKNLNLVNQHIPHENVSKRGFVNDLNIDSAVISEITALVSEDMKLYEHISENYHGLYSSVSETDWGLARLVIRDLPLASKYTGKLTVKSPLIKMVKKSTAIVDVEIINLSPMEWGKETEIHPVNLSYHWLHCTGETLINDGLRTELSIGKLSPQESFQTQMIVEAPDESGDFILVTTLVHEHIMWFEKAGFQPGKLEVEIKSTF